MTKTKKKKYEKPQVRKVNLDGRTSVLGFCKTQGTRNPGWNNCRVGINACREQGS